MTSKQQKNNFNIHNFVFTFELIFFIFLITGLIPRESTLLLAAGLIIYVFLVNIESATIFFVRSIPLFVALPLTGNFDSLNIWRILSIIIFLRWLASEEIKLGFLKSFRNFFEKPLDFLKNHKIAFLLVSLLVLALFSLVIAEGRIIALKRIIYFINLSLVGLVIHDLTKRKNNFAPRLVKGITIPVIIIIAAGFIQLGMTYLMDIYRFMRIWGEGIECRLFGSEWCYIAVNLGNTWFAYFGDQLSLRMFSLFPDSHSFPVFLLLGLASVIAISATARRRLSIWALLAVLGLLAAILSGTRGIWAAGGLVALSVFTLFPLSRRFGITVRSPYPNIEISTYRHIPHLAISKYLQHISCYLLVFILLFAVAYPIFASPQFLVSKSDSLILSKRVKSIIDFGETSNSQRIEIWKKSLQSIARKPFLGVGIGNFPVVLDQDLRLARAGSSAHNLYLQIGAEIGLPALIVALFFLWFVIKKAFFNFIDASDTFLKTYFSFVLIFLLWVLIYCLTDPAIFDERAFLMFASVAALILGFRADKVLQ